jgi:hypothetical protein
MGSIFSPSPQSPVPLPKTKHISNNISELRLHYSLLYIHESKTKKLDLSREDYIRANVSSYVGIESYDDYLARTNL